MRTVLIHPNHPSGCAEIAGNWPPARGRVADRAAETSRVSRRSSHPAMTNNLSDGALRPMLVASSRPLAGGQASDRWACLHRCRPNRGAGPDPGFGHGVRHKR